MAEWNHDTPWRQGFILTAESAKALGITHPEAPDDTVVLVISHDCDLAQLRDKEPMCEVIVGRAIDEERGDFGSGKNVRALHLTFSGGDTKLVGEFRASRKSLIDKNVLVDHVPAERVRVTPDELTTLQMWLAARYHRSAFPDEFDRRIKANKTHEKIAKVLKSKGTNLLAVLFDVDGGQEIARDGVDDTYTLSIYLLYRSANDPKAFQEAQSAAVAIAKIMRDRFLIDKKWQYIELVEVEPISDEAMTIHQSRSLRQWYADYISLAEDPIGPMLATPNVQPE